MVSKERTDVVIVGGGIMGCAAAWQLSRRGLSVVVLERSVPGAEASSAAAGILGAQMEAHADGPLVPFALKSRERYGEWSRELLEETGIDIEYRSSGVVRVGFSSAEVRAAEREYAFQRRYGCRVEPVRGASLSAVVNCVSERALGGVYLPDDARVDPPRLLTALRIAAERAGATFRSGAYVRRVLLERGRARGITLDDGSAVRGEQVIIAAGSWSSLVEGVPASAVQVRPARGQIVELGLPVPAFGPVLLGPKCYLVPRDDGRVLVGSTLEFVGFRREVTASAVHHLLGAAIELVPALAQATLRGAWSNFRPYTQDQTPIIGASEVKGLLIATGHYRNGILWAPITADILVSNVLGEPPPLPTDVVSPDRRKRARTRTKQKRRNA